jgi:eukaryotic-like serine/threonine-protein kinase
MTVEEVFLAALDIPNDSARSQYLAMVCGSDVALRQEVDELLGSHSRAGEFLNVPIGEQLQRREAHRTAELLGTLLDGKYRLLEILGEGGMGTVLSAQQLAPMIRTVAVKVVKAGMDSKAVLARFEAERQALALMEHPNIARVLDAGTTPDGRPYFVMERVEGVPITQYCDEQQLNLRQRLELFVAVCQAIQHAHQKGIIHRDIKPSNILVAQYDERPVPKVIDFGVAKAVAGNTMAEQTLLTGLGTIIGTLEYMSPEQANLGNLDVDTRSDVYSLGVLLYELLTSTTPVDRPSLPRAGFLEILRVVREVEATKPSTKLRQLENLQQVSANRRIEPAHLSNLIAGELDWVVLKAIEKDRTRRYDTANSLSRDIQRYLADECVEARPPSQGYRLKRFLRRHRGSVIAASLVLLALVGGLIGTTWQAIRAENALVRERRANELTAARLRQIEIINTTLFDIFSELDLRKVKEGNEPVQQLLAEKLMVTGQKLDAQAIHEPLVMANLQNRLGRTLANLGHARAAIPFLVSARDIRIAQLGLENWDTRDTQTNLAFAYKSAGLWEQALPLYEQVSASLQAQHGPDHPDTLTSLNNLALAYGAAGKHAVALPLLEETLKRRTAHHGQDHKTTLTSMSNLAGAYLDAKDPKRAVPLFEETLLRMKSAYGHDHADTLTVMNNLAMAYKELGQLEQAVKLYEETLKLRKARLGADHSATLTSMNNLAAAYETAGRHDKAVPLLEETLALKRIKLGSEHPSTFTSMSNLGKCYEAVGQLPRAILLFEESLVGRKLKLGDDHPSTLSSRRNLASAYDADRQFKRAERLHREQLGIVQLKSGSSSAEYATALRQLAENLMDQRKWPEAERLFREGLGSREASAPENFVTLNMQSQLGGTLVAQKKYADAEPILKSSFDRMKPTGRTLSSRRKDALRETAERLIDLYRATDRPREAAKWQAEARRYRERAPRPREAK